MNTQNNIKIENLVKEEIVKMKLKISDFIDSLDKLKHVRTASNFPDIFQDVKTFYFNLQFKEWSKKWCGRKIKQDDLYTMFREPFIAGIQSRLVDNENLLKEIIGDLGLFHKKIDNIIIPKPIIKNRNIIRNYNIERIERLVGEICVLRNEIRLLKGEKPEEIKIPKVQGEIIIDEEVKSQKVKGGKNL